MGLLSDGGVHSHIKHLFAIIDMAKNKGVENLYIHCFLDGRDVPPRCAEIYIKQLEEYMKRAGLGEIASISGRYYAMDRDSRWERVERAYDALTSSSPITASSAAEALEAAYLRNENDEFVQPTQILKDGRPAGLISDRDSVIMFNFRPDRAREITRTFCDADFNGFERKIIPSDIVYVCMTQYDASMPAAEVAFPPQHHMNTLGEYISKYGKKQLRLAETEKYAHVTFFFNGGVEEPNAGEERILIPSPKVATYDMQPEMSAFAVRDAAVTAIDSGKYDLIVINFANPDMVGHTGVFDAAVKAVETADKCVGDIYNAVLKTKGDLFITADHGNADTMLDTDGNIITAHSANPVPAIVITGTKVKSLRSDGILADIAPTLLYLMGLEQPPEMTGKNLIAE
jgi:2,3-bisphosphoglycerate-independent phosphoglycerate mutase